MIIKSLTFLYLLIAYVKAQSNTTAPGITLSIPGPENVTIQPNNTEAVHEVLQFGDNAIFLVSNRLQTFPPESMLAGEKILVDTRDGLQKCERALRETGLVWEYKVCCSSYLRYALSALEGLAHESNQSTGGRTAPLSKNILICFVLLLYSIVSK